MSGVVLPRVVSTHTFRLVFLHLGHLPVRLQSRQGSLQVQ